MLFYFDHDPVLIFKRYKKGGFYKNAQISKFRRMTYAILSREINDLLDLGKKLIRASGATLYRQQLIINYNRNIIVFFFILCNLCICIH